MSLNMACINTRAMRDRDITVHVLREHLKVGGAAVQETHNICKKVGWMLESDFIVLSL